MNCEDFGLYMNSFIRQPFDGRSVMVSKQRGVQKIIKFMYALCLPSPIRKLNLVVNDLSKLVGVKNSVVVQ